jgi:hypothetical protein
LIQFAHDLWTAGAMNGSIHTSTARQARISGIDNGIGRDGSNVALK